ncbi:MAG TPA: hypothetical protein VKX96_06730 [Chloroflexota bacterium]|nr:hypothetical protein [Chloroflexota bacterium]
MNELADEYLTDIDGQNREREAIRRFCATPFLLDDLVTALGVPAGFHWVLLGLPHGRLIEGRFLDVDLLAGPLASSDPPAMAPLITKNREAYPGAPEHLHRCRAALELAGKLWPPTLEYLVALEVKCAYFDGARQRVMSQKASTSNIRNLRLQIDELLEIVPFDRVALLDLIVNPPASGIDSRAWLAAAATGLNSFQKLLPTLKERLPSDSPAGHFAMPWGAVEGGSEASRGTGAPLALRSAVENPRLNAQVVRARRERMTANLRQFLRRPTATPRVSGGVGRAATPERVAV